MKDNRFAPRRPPWWPENEPFPPVGPPGRAVWRRGRFFVRAGLFVALLFFLAFFGALALFDLAARFLGLAGLGADWRPLALTALVVPFLFAAGLLLALRFLRRTALPAGDLVEAIGRVAEGDLGVKVEERGAPQIRGVVRSFNRMVDRLRDQEEQRRTLLAEVSHELRTPLSVLQGNLEGMLDGVYPRDDARLAAVLDETRVLARLIEDLRVLSLSESGALKLQRERADLGDLAAEVVASFQAEADRAGVALSTEFAPDLPELLIDATRVREVLANLIANALRYTPPGGDVRVRVWREAGSEPRQVVAVRDSGAGIPPEALPHIFDRFYKSPDSRGAGLGLAIAKNLVVAHGGEISATSRPGEGTEIRFSLPEQL